MAWDVVICGLGAMGSAALHALALRGKRVLALERHTSGHDRGSSHGRTRVIRLGYFERPSYVPLLRRAYALWRELETAAARPFLHVTGIVEIGPPTGVLVRGTLAASRTHALRHEMLTAAETMQRFPVFHLPPEYVAVWQGDGGFLDLEPAMAAQRGLAVAAGAEIHGGEAAQAVEIRPGGVRVVTERGHYEAGAAIIAAGPWTGGLVPEIDRHLRVTRQAVAWLAASALPAGFPVFFLESRHGMHYGIPPHDGAGMKIAKHHHDDQTVDPDSFDRRFSAQDETLIRAPLVDHAPSMNGRLVTAETCLYTMTPDGDFLIDSAPGRPEIVVASPCSGHGFKFAPVIGEILADLATTGATNHDIARFRFGRLVDRFRSSPALAARSDANFGIEDH
jgi:sarcosine oxidase